MIEIAKDPLRPSILQFLASSTGTLPSSRDLNSLHHFHIPEHTHSVSHAHFSDTFSLAWRTDIACSHGSRCLQCACHISPSHPLLSHVSSAVFAVPARSLRDHILVRTVFAGLHPMRKRGSSALPHERRGVWLPGRSHALQSYNNCYNAKSRNTRDNEQRRKRYGWFEEFCWTSS